jgi:hypothetical protein
MKAIKRELELDHAAYLSLCDRKLKDNSTGGLMAATVYLLEARKVRKQLERI